MFLPEKMCHLTLVASKKHKKKIVDYLYKKKVVHLKTIPVSDVFQQSSPDYDVSEVYENNAFLSSLLSNIESLLGVKSIKAEPQKSNALQVAKKLAQHLKELEHLKKNLSELSKKYDVVHTLKELGYENLTSFKDISEKSFVVGYGNNDKISLLLNKAKEKGLLYEHSSSDKDYVLIVFNSYDEIKDMLSYFDKYYIKDDVLDAIKSKRYVSQAFSELITQIQKYEQQLDELLNKIQEVYSKHKEDLYALKAYYDQEVDKLRGYNEFADTNYLFAVEGYVPCKHADKILKEIKEIDPKAYVALEEVDYYSGDAPVKLKFPKLLEGIHVLIEAYGMPKYGYLDPALFVFITFPLFYGFILGDAGYGLLLLALSLWLRTKFESKVIKGLLSVLALSAISSIFFGLLFGEFFGFEQLFGYHLPYVLHRMQDITTLMIISLIVGVVHVNFGLLLGAYQDIVRGKFWHALEHKFSWMFLEIGVGLIFYGLYKASSLSYVGWVFLILGVYLLYKAEGFKSIFELPSIFTNLLSYVRLAAVGLSSVAIAYLINVFSEKFVMSGSVWGIVAGVLLFVVGHAFNILLGVISPFLHTLRLHYVEFFTKFYKTGGEKYHPYGQRE